MIKLCQLHRALKMKWLSQVIPVREVLLRNVCYGYDPNGLQDLLHGRFFERASMQVHLTRKVAPFCKQIVRIMVVGDSSKCKQGRAFLKSKMAKARLRNITSLCLTRGSLLRNYSHLRLSASCMGSSPQISLTVYQRSFTRKAKVKKLSGAPDSFEPLGLWPAFSEPLGAGGVTAPTSIQRTLIPHMLKKRSSIVTAPTGTGKTLAYLLPLIQLLLDDEKTGGVITRLGRPRAMVVVPSRELALQVQTVAKQLSHVLKFRCSVVLGGVTQKRREQSVLGRPQDLLIATPGRAAKLVQQGKLHLGDLRYLVMDEADTLFHPTAGFTGEVDALLGPLEPKLRVAASAGSEGALQSTFVSATLSKRVRDILTQRFPPAGAHVLTMQATHRPPRLLQQEFVPVAGDKMEQLINYLLEHDLATSTLHPEPPQQGSSSSGRAGRVKRAIIFCNSVPSARAVALRLEEEGFALSNYHGYVPPIERQENWDRFASGQVSLLVATDLASRGLDTTQVTHVLNFDFPSSPIDYLHRVGRTARAGKGGKAVSFVGPRDQTLCNAIREALQDERPLDALFVWKKAPGTPAPTERAVQRTDRHSPIRAVGQDGLLGKRIRQSQGRHSRRPRREHEKEMPTGSRTVRPNRKKAMRHKQAVSVAERLERRKTIRKERRRERQQKNLQMDLERNTKMYVQNKTKQFDI
eukprot:g23489.t1